MESAEGGESNFEQGERFAASKAEDKTNSQINELEAAMEKAEENLELLAANVRFITKLQARVRARKAREEAEKLREERQQSIFGRKRRVSPTSLRPIKCERRAA